MKVFLMDLLQTAMNFCWPPKALASSFALFNRSFVCFVLLICTVTFPASAPLAAAPDLLANGYQDMYNLRFEAAHKAFHDYEQTSPDDPMGPVSDAAAYLFFEFEQLKILRSEFFAENSSFLSRKRMKADPQVKAAFEADLTASQALSEAMLKKKPNARSALLANVVRIALHADYLALIEKDNWQALTEVKESRVEADALIKQYPDCYDAYLAAGVENYLLSQKMVAVRMFLRLAGAQTDKQHGIQDLQVVAEKGLYLRPYAKILLAIAALRDDKQQEAVGLLKQLALEFPGNSLFQEEVKKLS